MDYGKLVNIANRKGMLKFSARLEPMGAGGLVYPPTYDKGKHIFRQAWVEGEEHTVVVLDTPQSQANRVEDALMTAMERQELDYPDIRIRIPRTDGMVEEYSVLQLSHRIYDAVLLATVFDSTSFPETEVGRALYGARQDAAEPLFRHAPITLVLGGWDSHAGGGPLTAKLARLLTSEIIGVDALPAERGAVKFDPMDIRKDAGPLYPSEDPVRLFEIDKPKGTKTKGKDPSNFGFGNVPALEERGASIRYAVQNAYVSLPAVRRLSFPGPGGARDAVRDIAGRAATVALALHGLCLQQEAGYNLRSGCDLMPFDLPQLEIIGCSSGDSEKIDFDSGQTKTLLDEALAAAHEHGLVWRDHTLVLEADERLRKLVERSRQAHWPSED